MELLKPADIKSFWDNGFLVVRNVFSPDEIEALRKQAYKVVAEDEKKGLVSVSPFNPNCKIVTGDLLSKEGLRDVVLDDRLLSMAQQILGGAPVYFGDSTFQVGEGARGFHKDNGDRTSQDEPDWQGMYPIIRFGIYLQDHTRYSGGLKVRVASHNTVSPTKGRSVFVNTAIGDVVVWNLRTSHSGNAVRLKGFPNLTLDSRIEKRIPTWLKKEEQKERIALFLSYGLKSAHLDRFINYLKGRDYAVKSFKASKFGKDVWDKAKAKGLEIIKAIPEYGEQS